MISAHGQTKQGQAGNWTDTPCFLAMVQQNILGIVLVFDNHACRTCCLSLASLLVMLIAEQSHFLPHPSSSLMIALFPVNELIYPSSLQANKLNLSHFLLLLVVFFNSPLAPHEIWWPLSVFIIILPCQPLSIHPSPYTPQSIPFSSRPHPSPPLNDLKTSSWEMQPRSNCLMSAYKPQSMRKS